MRKAFASQRGFSAVELVIVTLLIAVLIIVLLPKFDFLSNKVRISDVRMDAVYIGAAIEALKIEGNYSPIDVNLREKINEMSGKKYVGTLSRMRADGSFMYTRIVDDAPYTVWYDSPTGNIYEANFEFENTVEDS